jgi:integrase
VTAKLTALRVKNAKPQHNRHGVRDRTWYPDGDGMYLVVQPSGAKSFALRYRFGGRTRNLKLGDAAVSEEEARNGALTLAVARVRTAEARHQLEQGIDPGLRKPESRARSDRVEALVAQFLDLHAYRKTRPGTAQATERIFRRVVLPAWRGRSIHDLKRRDVIDLIETVATDRPYLANRTLSALSRFANWLLARDAIAASFCSGVERPHREVARGRTLNGMELRALWRVCAGDDPFERAVRLLILTGARRNEVSQMRWSEIDAERRLWTIPSERSKNGRAHALPLSAQAWKIVESAPRFVGCDYVLSADGHGPIAGWAKAKSHLSAKAGIDAATWRLHDLRRTSAAGMQALGVPVAIIEKALNHVSGTFRGIVGVYQTHDYRDEVRDALRRWANHVEALVSGKPAEDKVVSISGRR